MLSSLPTHIFSGYVKAGHVQGISVDSDRGFVYYSFTTVLVKTDLNGRLIGSVRGLTGHLGCIKYDPVRNLVFGSLEYKNDSIGRGIRESLGMADVAVKESFYVAIFDCDRITKADMDAEQDGVMLAAYLKEPSEDFAQKGIDENRVAHDHRYGCSGIDGLTLGPAFGEGKDSPYAVTVAYGIYGDEARSDNDYQVLCRYDTEELLQTAKPLSQITPHAIGPRAAVAQYFVYTGNTTWGVQNLEYDPHSHTWFMAVYCGRKPQYPNHPLYRIRGDLKPIIAPLKGNGDQTPRATLTVMETGMTHESGICGYRFPHGSTGLDSLGDGRFYISHPGSGEEGQCSDVCLYTLQEDEPFVRL